jgi:hypothetical protein
LECIRPPTRLDASKTVQGTPRSCNVSAAVKPEIPAPTIPMRGSVLRGAEAELALGIASHAALRPPKRNKAPRLNTG